MNKNTSPDFEYRTEDVAHLRGSYHGLRQAEDVGFWIGNVTGLPLGYYLGARRNWSFLGKGLSALVGGSLVFYLFTLMPRRSYEDVARKVNRTYAITISKILED